MTIITDIERSFTDLTNKINPSALEASALNIQSEYFISNTTKLGARLNDITGGFKSVTQELDDIIPQLSTSLQEHIPNNKAIVQLTNEVGALKSRLVSAVGSAKTDLESITGGVSSVSEELLDVVVTSGVPEAMSSVLKTTANALPDEIKSVVATSINTNSLSKELQNISGLIADPLNQLTSSISSINLNSVLNSSIGNVFNLQSSQLNSLSSLVEAGNNIQQNALNIVDNGLSSIVGNLVEKVTGNINLTVNGLVDREITANTKKQIANLIELGNITEAAVIAKRYSSLPLETIEQSLRLINPTLNGQLTGDANRTARRLDSKSKEWRGDDTPTTYDFTYIKGGEELEADLRSVKREITEIIVHWSDTYSDQDIGAEEIHELVKENNGSMPYHYVFRRNGKIQRGRPVDILGEPLNNNHDQYSIQIVFVGGIIAPSSTTSKYEDQPRGSRSFKNTQFAAFDKFLRTAYNIWPGVQVLGHNEIDNTQSDPGFRPSEYVLSKFGKRSVYTQPNEQAAYSRDELVALTIEI